MEFSKEIPPGKTQEEEPNYVRNKSFYTVREAARLLRVGPSTLYRIIREGDFPAVRLRSRYIVPAATLDRLISAAEETGSVVDPSRIAAEHRTACEIAQATGGAKW